MASLPIAVDPVNAWEVEPEPQPGFNVEELVTALKREYDASESEWERLSDFHRLAQDFYEAKPFGNEVTGRSQIVLPDVQETIDYMATSVLRTFVSGDRVVEFEATDEEDEAGADQATAAIGFNFMRQQDGFRILHDWCVSGLMQRYGVAKTMMVTEERVKRDTIMIADPVELEGLGVEVEASEAVDGGWNVSIKQQIREKRFIDVAVPASEFRFSPNARHEDEADYLAHCPIKTRSDLVDMGFDREQVYGLPAYTRLPGDRAENHDSPWENPESTPALVEVQLCEEYARIDIDGDGIAERVKVFRVENTILKWATGELAIETVDEQPFSVFCPFPRPHRLVGYSLADKVMDIQLARSTIARQLFDGLYAGNMPRPIVSERGSSENTIDDLLSPIAGAPIRVAEMGAVMPFETGFDVGKSLTVLEWITGERESRTGITRLNQGLDADALNKTATGTALMQAQGQQQEEFIARNLAEAFARLMAKKYRLWRREGEPFKAKVDGTYQMIDPASWPEEINVTIRVGLGTGSKDKRIQARMALAPIMAEGFANGQVKPEHLFHAVDGLVRDLGLGQGDDYWTDPASEEAQAQPEQPDPEMLAMQAEQQREQKKMEFEQQKAAAQIELERQKAEANLEALRDKHALEIEQQREKAALTLQLDRERAAAEADIAIYRIDREADVKRYAADVAGKRDDGDIGQNREGGRLDA